MKVKRERELDEEKSNVDLLFRERSQDCPMWAFEGYLYKNKHLFLINDSIGRKT